MTTNTLSPAEIIAQAMREAIRVATDNAASMKAGKDALDAESDANFKGREGMLRKMATLSRDNQWSLKDIDAGVTAAINPEGGVKLASSIKSYTSEIRTAMLPTVRSVFDDIMNAAVAAWDEEDTRRELAEKKSEVPAPVRKAFKRRYHTIKACMSAQAKSGRTLDTVDAVVAYAHECDPDINAEKAAKEIETIMDRLSVIASNFPAADIRSAYDKLELLCEDTLASARAGMLADRVARVVTTAADMKNAPAAPAPAATPAADVLNPPPAAPAPAASPLAGLFQIPTPNTTMAAAFQSAAAAA